MPTTTTAIRPLEFNTFNATFYRNMHQLVKNVDQLYMTDVDKDSLWAAYINSFPAEQRQEHNCNSCRQFIKNWGNLVVINSDYTLTTIWSFETGDQMYQHVINQLDQLVKSATIRDVFVTTEAKLGNKSNVQQLPDGSTVKWEHLYFDLPERLVSRSRRTVDSDRGELRQSKQVFKRALEELTIEATETVLDLISQGSLYRGEEYKGALNSFLQYQRTYAALPAEAKDNYCWLHFKQAGAVARIRNQAIGVLLQDCSADIDLDMAVRKFEAVMAPHNYRRPKPIISKRMVEQAEQTIAELGLTNSLARKFADVDDLTVNNVLFVNRNKTAAASIFGELKEDIPVNPKALKRVQKLSLQDFMANVVPTARSIRLLLENSHDPNMVSLIAPADMDSPPITKWDNGFSWCYNNNVADSIREKVKSAGGKVDGLLRVSLAWFSYSDLDLHIYEPDGSHIFFGNKQSPRNGQLDVDMNAGGLRSKTPVENIIYPYNSRPLEGRYEIKVHNYSDREPTNQFSVEVEFGGEIFEFNFNDKIKGGQKVDVATFTYSAKDGIKFEQSISSKLSTKEIWGLKTNKFHEVKLVCYSPNYWQEPGVGNKHVFFMLEGCQNNGPVRGLFNEFIKEELNRDHRRVFEALANKMAVAPTERQLSGVGFSTTSEGSFYCEVESTFKRTLKVVV